MWGNEMENKIKKAYKELYVIINNSTEEVKKKIPNSFMDYVKLNMATDYNYEIKFDVNKELDILEETKTLLVSVYKDFLM